MNNLSPHKLDKRLIEILLNNFDILNTDLREISDINNMRFIEIQNVN